MSRALRGVGRAADMRSLSRRVAAPQPRLSRRVAAESAQLTRRNGGVAGSCLSGTAAEGRRCRREDGRLDRLSRCCADPGAGGSMGLVDCYIGRAHSSVRKQPQVTCASRADDIRRRAPHQDQLPRHGRSELRSWRGKRGRPADETRPDGARGTP